MQYVKPPAPAVGIVGGYRCLCTCWGADRKCSANSREALTSVSLRCIADHHRGVPHGGGGRGGASPDDARAAVGRAAPRAFRPACALRLQQRCASEVGWFWTWPSARACPMAVTCSPALDSVCRFQAQVRGKRHCAFPPDVTRLALLAIDLQPEHRHVGMQARPAPPPALWQRQQQAPAAATGWSATAPEPQP